MRGFGRHKEFSARSIESKHAKGANYFIDSVGNRSHQKPWTRDDSDENRLFGHWSRSIAAALQELKIEFQLN